MNRVSLACKTPVVVVLLVLAGAGCARLPYPTRVIADDARVAVLLQHEVEPSDYSHPVHLSVSDLSAILRGFSVRAQVTVPLRWYAEEQPPKPLFREDEIEILAPRLAEGLAAAGRDERVYFELRAPGLNPRYDRDVTAGWIAVRESYLHIVIEYVHSQQPATRSSPYDVNYPTPRSAPGSYVLSFEPGRFWVLDPKINRRAVDVQAFVHAAPGGPSR